MDQEAEAMKTKKILWPWAERQVKVKRRLLDSLSSGLQIWYRTTQGMKFLTIQKSPMTPVPLRSVNGSTPSCA